VGELPSCRGSRRNRAVKVMGAVQLGRDLDPASVALIGAFLESLTGDLPANYAAPR